MSRSSTCIFLIFALLALIPTNQSQSLTNSLNLRNLASTDSSIKTYDLIQYGSNYVINVDLGDEYRSRHNLNSTATTSMVVFLFSSFTAFCTSCMEFVHYDCPNNTCNADAKSEHSFLSLHYVFRQANPMNQTVIIGGNGNSANAPWSLAVPASYYKYNNADPGFVFTQSSLNRYIYGNASYGILGLGVGFGAAANFKGDYPLFSISMNSSGHGQLIFGKNSSLYDPAVTPIVLPTDTNWTMITQNITFGPHYTNTTFTSDIIFDLQYPGIGLPWSYWSESWGTPGFLTNLERNYNVKQNNSFGVENFPYTYYGNLSNLPNLTISMTNGQTINIPPSVYTRKSPKANDTYSLLIDRTSIIREKSFYLTGRNCTVLGWPVLAHFYTVFEQKNGSEPTITLYPAITPRVTESSILGMRFIQGIAVVALLAVVFVCFRNRAASKLQNELREELKPAKARLLKNEGGYQRL